MNPAIHYHHAWLIWVLYFLGAMIHISLQVNDISKKNKLGVKAVWSAIGPAVTFRQFFAAMVFGLLWHYPLIISQALKMVGINVGGDESEVLAIPMNNFIAGLYGLMLDSLFGYIPGLKSWLPDVTPNVTPVPKTTTTAVILLLIALPFFSGCSSTEKSAYNTVVAAKAFTDKIAQANPQCSGKTVDPTKLCVYLRTAVSAKDLLIDAIEVYCAGPNFNGGGSCDPPDKGSPAYAQANQKLQAAIQGYGQAEKDLKGVIH